MWLLQNCGYFDTEDLNSLDNDSFLNSLEAITVHECWPGYRSDL